METKEQCRFRQSQPAAKEKRHSRERERYLNDPEFREASRRRANKYYQLHKVEIRERSKQNPWYKKHRREWMRNWYRKKRREDARWNIRNRLSSRLWHAVTKAGGLKANKTIELIGCSISEFQTYLKSLFKPGMTWDYFLNGKIHIDHIKPCSKFDLTKPEEQMACFHFSNLQPLWDFENLQKKDSYTVSRV